MSRMCKIIPAEVADVVNGSLILNLPNGEQYKVEGGHIPMRKGSLIKFDKDSFLKLTTDVDLDGIEEISEDKADVSKSEDKNHAIWQNESIRILIDWYKELGPQVGSHKMKSMKSMWEQVALKLRQEGYMFNGQQCQSKWKTMVRSYRSSLSGSSRKSHHRGIFDGEIEELLSKQGITFEVVDENESDDEEVEKNGQNTSSKSSLNQKKMANTADSNTSNSDSETMTLIRAFNRRTAQREKTEQIKIDQRERLINAIEERNKLLKQIHSQRNYKIK